jgi:Transcriptional Coactivator p15 (PC4)
MNTLLKDTLDGMDHFGINIGKIPNVLGMSRLHRFIRVAQLGIEKYLEKHMSKKTFELSETKAIRVEAVEINGANFISLRQLYKTKKAPDEWQYGKQGITLPVEEAARIAKMITKFATDDSTTFKTLELGKKDES